MPRVRESYSPTVSLRTVLLRCVLLCVSFGCFAWLGLLWLDREMYRAAAEEEFAEAILAARTPTRVDAPPPPVSVPSVNSSSPLAKLRIARLGVTGFVEEGFDAKTLRRSIGLFPDGAKPGEPGNMILAAHRDTYFAGLREVREGDVIEVTASSGRRYKYSVSRLFVVDPLEEWVLDATPGRRMLTLITCYPFRYVGSAPQRFVVQAEPLDGVDAPVSLRAVI